VIAAAIVVAAATTASRAGNDQGKRKKLKGKSRMALEGVHF